MKAKNQQKPVERIAWSPAELASATGKTRQHICNLIARGDIRSVKLGRSRLIPASEVERLLKDGTNTPAR